MTLNKRTLIGTRYCRRVGVRLSARLMARVRTVAEARELRISELVRDALIEKLARIEAEMRPP